MYGKGLFINDVHFEWEEGRPGELWLNMSKMINRGRWWRRGNLRKLEKLVDVICECPLNTTWKSKNYNIWSTRTMAVM